MTTPSISRQPGTVADTMTTTGAAVSPEARAAFQAHRNRYTEFAVPSEPRHRSAPAGTVGGGVEPGEGDMLAQVCRDNLQGLCKRGMLCRFQHLSQKDANAYCRQHIRDGSGVAGFCRDHLNGGCKRKVCKFYHGTPEEQAHMLANTRANVPVPADLQCRDFVAGKCTRGAQCKFFHMPGDVHSQGDVQSLTVTASDWATSSTSTSSAHEEVAQHARRDWASVAPPAAALPWWEVAPGFKPSW
jgi:hypothetical protein